MSRCEELKNALNNAFECLLNPKTEEYKYVSVFDPNSMRNHVYVTKLHPSILEIDGMSGVMFRIFLNNLLSDVNIKSYLEIGCWTGSTAISAMYNNNIENHWLIDNWCEWGNNGLTEKTFHSNWNTFISDRTPVLIDKDCFGISPKDHGISEVDVYFCDGGNEENNGRNAYKALTHYYDAMADSFIFIADDWWSRTPNSDFGSTLREQTEKAIKDTNLKVVYHVALPQNNNTMSINGSGDRHGWWNGCGIFVLSK